MAIIKIRLEQRKDIVKFNFLYSLHQHLGWPRSDKDSPEEISIYTTSDLFDLNQKVLINIGNWVSLKII
jgi:hypothetical protein